MKYLLLSLLFLLTSQNEYNSFQDLDKPYAVSSGEVREWVSYLASDEMKGRQNGSVQMEEAARWIASKFSDFSAVPASNLGEYFQPYEATSRRGSVKEKNVIAIIPGTDPSLKNEYIILSAHFDHVGIRNSVDGDSIYNGADDNAAGTCALLGIAKTIKENNIKPGRSIILAAFSGEEIGMRGSRFFVRNSPVDLSKVYANLNFEMIGHSEYLGPNNYYMTGCSNSNLDDIISGYNINNPYTLVDTIGIAERLFFASDNISFARVSETEGIMTGIPCGTFATTTYADYIHSPDDEVGIFDFENMAGLIDHFSNLVVWLSWSSEKIDWTSPSFKRLD